MHEVLMQVSSHKGSGAQTSEAFGKVILLGDSGVGKTSVLRRFSDGEYENQRESTIGVDYCSKTIRGCRLQIWDTAGEERFRAITNMYLRNVDVCMVVFDLTRVSSAKSVRYWTNLVRQYSPEAAIIVVGNQADASNQPNEQWGFWDGVDQMHFPSTEFPNYHAVSAKTDMGVKSLFEHVVTLCDKSQHPPTATSSAKELETSAFTAATSSSGVAGDDEEAALCAEDDSVSLDNFEFVDLSRYRKVESTRTKSSSSWCCQG